MVQTVGFPRGIPAASLKQDYRYRRTTAAQRFPRGIPAASLKLAKSSSYGSREPGFPRGIPAASLKLYGQMLIGNALHEFSAGNTRGLIEALFHNTHDKL